MYHLCRCLLLASLLAACFASRFAIAQVEPSAGMLRYPDISQTEIVFCYADDLWIVDKAGGLARPLASPAGHEQSPKFNADGSRIAFIGNYEGDSDLYEIATQGGTAKRMTYHPDSEMLCDFTPEGGLLYSTSGFAKLSRMMQLFQVSEDHPVPVQLPVPYGTNGALDAQGEWLAYTPYSRDSRTWKRYRGGMASDIWLFNLKNYSSKQITEWEGTDSYPMWHEETLYYLSDQGPEHRLNIWMYDLDGGKSEQVTKFKKFDVKYPSIGPGTNGEGEIVFQVGADLRVLNLKSRQSKLVKVQIPGDRPTLRPLIVDAAEYVQAASISPNAKRVAVEARGDIWTAPAKNGSPRNLTRSSGVAERSPAWSPDGQWIAFFSDADGDYELNVIQSDGMGKTRRLTRDGGVFKFDPKWSPDSKKLFYCDKSGSMFVYDLESEKSSKFDQDPYSQRPSISWSHDSKWLVYARSLDNVARSQIRVLELATGKTHAISSGYFNDTAPAFDRQGKFIYYVSNRDFSEPQYEDVGTTFIYDNTAVLIALPLQASVENPLLPQSDEESWDQDTEDANDDDSHQQAAKADPQEESAEDGKSQKRRKKRKDSQKQAASAAQETEDESLQSENKDEKSDVVIDFDDLEARGFQIPVASGQFDNLQINADNQLIYVRASTKGGSNESSIRLLKIEEGQAEEETVLEGVRSFELTPDGKQLLAFARGKLHIVPAKAGQKLEDAISTEGMRVEIDRRAEWQQIFADAWRMERDFFYDPNMHGVDWNAIRERYAELLDDCVSRYDLSYVIREMISELNVGHAYYREADLESGPTEPVGLLGCQFEIRDDQVCFGTLWQGGPWDTNARNPLIAAGVQSGDKLLSVESVPVSATQNPYRHFQGRVGRAITLRVQTGDDEPRTVVVKPQGSDYSLRFWGGIEATRRYVEEQSDGQIGYIYVTNTSIDGQNDL
ncbi:MAG: PDZ domain-containing protein, partial [bacterium]|nr:PDZ domain-containing protein [bacterium]